MIHPSVHHDGRTMCCKYNLHIGIERQYEVDELLLSLHMQAHLRLIHKQHIRATVLDEHREQYDEHLLLAA